MSEEAAQGRTDDVAGLREEARAEYRRFEQATA